MFEGKLPGDIVNRALDRIGRSDIIVGDIEEGSEAAKPALRAYGPALRCLLRSAHWAFSRKQTSMRMLADATGQTPNVGTLVPAPWTYEYEYPIDCMKVRFVPWNSNPVQPNPPLMTGLAQPPLQSIRLRPAPFLVTTDSNYPIEQGANADWATLPQWWGVEGAGPTTRNVILTNVPPSPTSGMPTSFPSVIYTAFMPYPSNWDPLFEQAMVAYLAQDLAMPLSKDKRIGLAVRAEMIKTVKEIVSEARAASGNESGYPQTTDSTPDWVRVRNQGGGRYGGFGDTWGGGGGTYGSWDGLGFSNGDVF